MFIYHPHSDKTRAAREKKKINTHADLNHNHEIDGSLKVNTGSHGVGTNSQFHNCIARTSSPNALLQKKIDWFACEILSDLKKKTLDFIYT